MNTRKRRQLKIKHWDLTPKQMVTLIREDGKKIDVQFLFRDTVRCYCRLLDDEQCDKLVQFQLMPNGDLKDCPTREQLLRTAMSEPAGSSSAYLSPSSFDSALMNCKRWKIV